MSAEVESARRDWEDGFRRLTAASHEPLQRERLHRQVEVITEELRRRVGGTFTLAELAQAYASSESWVRHAVEEKAPTPGWVRDLASVTDAAFHLYARGAVDYAP